MLIFIALVGAVVASLGAPLITAVATTFGVPLSSAQWTLTLPLLAGAVITPVLGRLGSGRYRRHAVLGALGTVMAGSALTVLPLPFAVLLIGRGLQGAGLGVTSLLMAVARDHLPPSRSASTVAALAVTTTVGIGIGYPVAGLVTDLAGVRAAYGLGFAATVVAFVAAWMAVPTSDTGRTSKVDVAGALLLGAGLLGLLLVITETGLWRAHPALAGAGLAASTLVLVAWGWFERRQTQPLIDLALLRRPAVLGANVCMLVGGAGAYLLLTLVTRYVQTPSTTSDAFGAPTFAAGLVLVPFSLFGFLAGQATPRLQRGVRPVSLLAASALVMVVGFVLFATERAHLVATVTTMAVLGAGVGSFSAAMPGVILATTPAAETSVAMGANQVVRSVGFATGSALGGLVLATATAAGAVFPAEVGYTEACWWGIALMLVTVLIALTMARRPASATAWGAQA